MFQTAVIPSFGPFSLAQKERLKTAHPRQEVHFFDHLPIPAELAGFDCIIGNPPVSLIKELPDLKLLQLFSAGVDVYVNDPDYPRQVILANASGAYGEIIAEFTKMCIRDRKFSVYTFSKFCFALSGEDVCQIQVGKPDGPVLAVRGLAALQGAQAAAAAGGRGGGRGLPSLCLL